ncbi:hypothetical protein ACFV3F_03425 [Streptomyces sp. NPDC059717]|uniref:hypothetical protein n=1 Tax=Streptomyces sp. NPDC059717 TaxID=3346922 RepID=UPI003688D9D8
MTEATDTTPVWGRASLPLPGVGDLSEEQQRGASCVWCTNSLTAETAIDLGERRIRVQGSHVTAFPRGCHPCTQRAALRALHDHAPGCISCIADAGSCDIGMALRRLMREARRS